MKIWRKSSTIKEITKNWIDQFNPYEKRSRSNNFIVPGLKNSFKLIKQAQINIYIYIRAHTSIYIVLFCSVCYITSCVCLRLLRRRWRSAWSRTRNRSATTSTHATQAELRNPYRGWKNWPKSGFYMVL